MKGVNGKILKVDLSSQEYTIDEHGEKFYRKYIGGRGIALYYMHKELDPSADPYSPENMLVFAGSILVGAQGPAIPRLTVCGKSPLTGGFGESEAGGYWAPELKQAGFDAVVVTGRADNPVYLWIKDGEVEFKDARRLWGKVTGEVQKTIREDLGDERIHVAQIGPGAENQVRYGNITNKLGHFNGRCGLGAVMGAKNLKALAVRGTQGIELADKEKVLEINRWVAREGMEIPVAKIMHESGTWTATRGNQEAGALPTDNWNKSQFEGIDNIDDESWQESFAEEGRGCFACPIRCKRVVEVDDDDIQVDSKYGGPEYETVGAMGSILGVESKKVIAKANELCNKYTLDTISTGMTIAFAMECYENGLLTREDCDGLELKFGNEEVVLPMIRKIATREGIGDLLAEGTKEAAKRIGGGAEKYVYHVKGQEAPMHDPRVKTGVGLQYALANYGADHMKAPHDTDFTREDSYGLQSLKPIGLYEAVDPLALDAEKVRVFYNLEIYWTLIDITGCCCFGYVPSGPVSIEKTLDLIKAVTGEYISLKELMDAAERSIDMARVFNNKIGFTPEDDSLPDIFFEDFADGPHEGEGGIDKEDFQKAVELYYEMMGWDPKTARPSKAKLVKMGIDWIREDG
ncbi:aldehyde ferredoxin oxidoreductase family protein [Halarsenatibacter silvermanii]|uniref:Aldehyde:ferredoxin oxidoreductase n=1 Tax=Halarsenatibacter silvermanii TaxID=321763 RepID=A0A1G9QGI6_9FIRM|nr:aldehyde ferredoxin oxidoreductase family protein [Halarsenatibacter silvermanii]SDM10000.1 aldehyde:ferredoxin oxidoreductase [Halarsenatibacter silvermanii]